MIYHSYQRETLNVSCADIYYSASRENVQQLPSNVEIPVMQTQRVPELMEQRHGIVGANPRLAWTATRRWCTTETRIVSNCRL